MLVKYLILILLLFASQMIFPQFNQKIFSKYFTQNESSLLWNSVLGLGDQNNDGYDDILIYECNRQTAGIYFGGSPMDTIPVLEFYLPENINAFLGLTSIDINGDSYRDIIVNYVTFNGTYVKGYYGGSILDTIPDIIISPPNGASIFFGYDLTNIRNFDGSERSVLVFKDLYLPYSNKELGALYFYNTYPVLDTIPFAIMKGDSSTNYELQGITGTGDINGDGLTDFSTLGTRGYPRFRRNFYLGNTSWDLMPNLTYEQEEHIFELDRMWIIEDINKDGKDDILTEDYDDTYPYWYNLAIWHGSFPIDTIPDEGINAQASTIVYGQLVCSPGDVNGDTFNDLMIGIGGPGGVFSRLWLGSRIMPDDPIKSWGGNGTYGNLLANIGDIDGDNVNDICVGNAGLSTSCSGFRTDFIYIFKGDTSVKIDTGTVSVETQDIIPYNFELKQNYPNPFNPSTKIKFTIPNNVILSEAKNLTILKVYDVLGNEIATLVNKELIEGEYEVELNASALPSGIYFYQLKAENFIETKKMVLLK